MFKSQIVGSVLFFIAFVLPILGMMNCEGWGGGSFSKSSSCVVGDTLSLVYADFYYSLLTIATFTFLIPLFIYVGATLFVIKITMKAVDETSQDDPSIVTTFGKPLSLEKLMKKDSIPTKREEE
jgi:hypothetical protein